MSFKTMDDELLIECVRVHEEIYNPTHKLYNDVHHKDDVWRSIGSQLNKSAYNCKTKWIYLRDQFRKSLNKRKQGINKTYKYHENLQFLIPFFKERDKKRAEKCVQDSNQFELVLDDISISQIESLEENSVGFEEEEEIEQKPKRRKLIAESTGNQRIIDSTSTISSNTEIIRIKNEEDFEEKSDPLGLGKNTSNSDVSTSKNTIDSFFAAMAETVKTFSPYNQVIAKSKIFSVISNLEMKQIQQEAGETTNDDDDSN